MPSLPLTLRYAFRALTREPGAAIIAEYLGIPQLTHLRKLTVDGEKITLWPRTNAEVFAALHRAGYRVDMLLEPEPLRSSDPGPSVPTTIIWRARKEGV